MQEVVCWCFLGNVLLALQRKFQRFFWPDFFFWTHVTSSTGQGDSAWGWNQPRRTGQRWKGPDPWRHLQITDVPFDRGRPMYFITIEAKFEYEFLLLAPESVLIHSLFTTCIGELWAGSYFISNFPQECSRLFHSKGKWFFHDWCWVVSRNIMLPKVNDKTVHHAPRDVTVTREFSPEMIVFSGYKSNWSGAH